MSTTDYSTVLADSSLIFLSVTSILFSLGMMGVPLLANGFGLSGAGSWHTIAVALIVMAAAGYLFIRILTDLFSGKSSSYQTLITPKKQIWKPLTITGAFLVLCGVFVYMKLRTGGGGGGYSGGGGGGGGDGM